MIARIITALILIVFCRLDGFAADQPAAFQPVVIDFFFEVGCADCAKVRTQVLPELRARAEGFYTLLEHDVGERTNVALLIAYQKKLGIRENQPVLMVVDQTQAFNGFDEIKRGLIAQVEKSSVARLDPEWKSAEPVAVQADSTAADSLRTFTPWMVIAGGLVDGINPCAISTLVFFMSLLSVAGVRGRGLLAMGVTFCLASFLTYTAIGLGLLRAIHMLDEFEHVRFLVEAGMMVLLCLFACLSFRDAYRFRKSGNPGDVTLQLPDSLKMRIHRIMRGGLGLGSLTVGGLVTGTLVTAIESLCTGQVYVPTLVMIIRSGPAADGSGLTLTAWRYLLLYNLMFIGPLVSVFLLTYFGLKTRTLLDWSRKNVVVSKVLLGLFFLAMAVFVAVFRN